jgi:hypothetical protein
MSVPLQAIQISWASPDADEEKTTRMPSDENDWTVSPQSESKRPDTTLMRRTCHACAIALRSLEVLTMLTCTASSPDAHLSPGLPRRSVKTRHMSRQCASSTSAPDGTVRTASSRTSCVIRQDSRVSRRAGAPVAAAPPVNCVHVFSLGVLRKSHSTCTTFHVMRVRFKHRLSPSRRSEPSPNECTARSAPSTMDTLLDDDRPV